jgi:hypothetical protein
MFISFDQIQKSLDILQSVHPFYGTTFLACKAQNLPVNRTISFAISIAETQILNEFYRPDISSNYFFRVFSISDKVKRWVKRDKYPTSTLQSIRTRGSFSEPFIHELGTDKWGWRDNYLQILANNLSKNSPPHRDKKIPAFHLAIWLFRSREWLIDTKPEDIVQFFLSEFRIEPEERTILFDVSIPESLDKNFLFQDQPVTWKDLQKIVGYPPDSKPEEGAALQFIELRGVGPAENLRYEPSQRLNIITGDNGLGKTFLLETIWWSLTGEWLDYPALPRKNVSKSYPKITFSVGSNSKSTTSDYSWETQTWKYPLKRDALPGLVVYARYDGSFAVWDPARVTSNDQNSKPTKRHVFFNRADIWDGLKQDQWICNGLIRDWVSWQTSSERYREHYNTLVSCLKALSSSTDEPLSPGQPTRLPMRDSREFPTLKMFGDEIPVVLASAGIQRIIAFAYILVWAWQEHLENSKISRTKPQRSIVLIVDEIEAHLHPRWQRAIIPALINVISQLEASVSPQIHVATHSPMVMASSEIVFNKDVDNLHHLKYEKQSVILEEISFVRRGRSYLWLMSDVFGLSQPRSLPAEQAIDDAKKLQLSDTPSPEIITEVNIRLIRYLSPDDEFWPRWRYFAQSFGANNDSR